MTTLHGQFVFCRQQSAAEQLTQRKAGTDPEANQRQSSKHNTLNGNTHAQTMCEDALILGLGLTVHNILFNGFHAKSDGRQGVRNQVDPQQLHEQSEENHQRCEYELF